MFLILKQNSFVKIKILGMRLISTSQRLEKQLGCGWVWFWDTHWALYTLQIQFRIAEVGFLQAV